MFTRHDQNKTEGIFGGAIQFRILGGVWFGGGRLVLADDVTRKTGSAKVCGTLLGWIWS